jgi:hypothetical protein
MGLGRVYLARVIYKIKSGGAFSKKYVGGLYGEDSNKKLRKEN